MPKMIANMNARVNSRLFYKRKGYDFDGTVKGAALVCSTNSIPPETKILVNFGGKDVKNARAMKVVLAPHDDRANGIWIV